VPARNWLGSLTLFSRWEENVIDWIRSSPAEKWRTANIRDLRTDGMEIGLERSLGEKARIGTRYSRFSVDPGAIHYTSKYVLDYARDTWSTSVAFPLPLSFEYQQSLLYKRRADGRDYWILDGRLERHFQRLTASVEFTNLLNTAYQEVLGANMPGRWFVISLRTR
jgi:outer membrane receptor protein involved in Fe transport